MKTTFDNALLDWAWKNYICKLWPAAILILLVISLKGPEHFLEYLFQILIFCMMMALVIFVTIVFPIFYAKFREMEKRHKIIIQEMKETGKKMNEALDRMLEEAKKIQADGK